MSAFQPPPTYADVVIIGPTGKPSFSPVWLKWFLDLAAFLSATGGAAGSVVHNNTTSKQGGGGTEFYHLLAADYILLAGASSLTNHGILLGRGAAAIGAAAAMTNGQLIIGATGADPAPQTVTGDVAITAGGVATVGSHTAWTPADNSGAALAFTGVSANYTKIGNMIFAYAAWSYPVTASGANASISGLPVASANANYAQVPSVVDTSASITGGLVAVPVKNTTTFNFDVGTPFGPATNLQLSAASIAVMLTYPAA